MKSVRVLLGYPVPDWDEAMLADMALAFRKGEIDRDKGDDHLPDVPSRIAGQKDGRSGVG